MWNPENKCVLCSYARVGPFQHKSGGTPSITQSFVIVLKSKVCGVYILCVCTLCCRGGGGGGEEGEGGVWWMERGDFSVPRQLNDQSESTDTADSESTGELFRPTVFLGHNISPIFFLMLRYVRGLILLTIDRVH